MKSLIALLIILPINSIAQDAVNFGRGGISLTSSSYLGALINSPVNLNRDKFYFEINMSLDASKSLIELTRENSKIESGSYNQKITPYYGSANVADIYAGIGLGYKGFSFFPRVIIANGVAVLNDPAYPDARADLTVSEGYGLGYATNLGDFLLGASFIDLESNHQVSEQKLLNYSAGTTRTIYESQNQIYNAGLGYKKKDYKIVINYKHSTLSSELDHYGIGSEYRINKVKLYVELKDIQSNNFENMSHIGVSYFLENVIFSTGLNQLYPTYGLGFNSKYFKVFGSYGGVNQYEQFRKEYRSYALSIIFTNF